MSVSFPPSGRSSGATASRRSSAGAGWVSSIARGPAAGPQGRAQAARSRPRATTSASAAVPARVALAASIEHAGIVPIYEAARSTGSSTSRCATSRAAISRRCCGARAAGAGAGGRPRRRSWRRAGRRARARARAPRRQAQQRAHRPRRRRRARLPRRFRHHQARRVRDGSPTAASWSERSTTWRPSASAASGRRPRRHVRARAACCSSA